MRSKVIDLGRLNDPAQRRLLAEAVFIADRAESDNVRQDSDDDPAALASAVDAVLDEAAELIAGVDMTTLPPEVAQACALIVAAETAVDALLESMGIYDPDDDESSEPDDGRSKDVDTQQPTKSVGERQSRDAQQDTDSVVERPSPLSAATYSPHKSDAQRSTPAVGERPSKPLGRRDIDVMLRRSRDNLLTIKREGKKL
jgi:hypothetical protein